MTEASPKQCIFFVIVCLLSHLLVRLFTFSVFFLYTFRLSNFIFSVHVVDDGCWFFGFNGCALSYRFLLKRCNS